MDPECVFTELKINDDKFYAHSRTKRAIDLALVNSGAMENFMNLRYAQYLGLPIQEMAEPQMVFNVDGTPNKSGEIKYYTDLKVQTGPKDRKSVV